MKEEKESELVKPAVGRKKKDITKVKYSVWLFESDKRRLEQLAKKTNMSFSPFCEKVLVEKKFVILGEQYTSLLNQVSKIGININQIAKNINIDRQDPNEQIDYRQAIFNVQEKISEIKKLILEDKEARK